MADTSRLFHPLIPELRPKISTHLLFHCTDCDLSISSAALAHMYFERLALHEKVQKENRDVYASVCLMLAVKYNEDKDTMADNLKVSE